GPSHCIS
ncbi:hypothetical protein D030_5424B, partial [Vibrio parahaemolyticus AQ3810]